MDIFTIIQHLLEFYKIDLALFYRLPVSFQGSPLDKPLYRAYSIVGGYIRI